MLDFATIYNEYAPDVYRFALYLSGDRATAEDLTSETFVRLWTARDVRAATVKAYLFAIVRNLHLQGFRIRRREVPLDITLPDQSPNPEMYAAGRDQLRWVLDRLRQLPETDRAALLMRIQQEMSYEEIAAVLGLSVAATKVRVHRARLKLARLWSEENSGNNP